MTALTDSAGFLRGFIGNLPDLISRHILATLAAEN
jgi:hypothetical protein